MSTVYDGVSVSNVKKIGINNTIIECCTFLHFKNPDILRLMVKKLKINTRGLLKSIFSQRHFRDGLRFFRTSKILDKNTSFMYNTGQTPRSFLAAVLRRLHQKLKGYRKSVVHRFSSTNFLPNGRRSTVMKTNFNFSHGRFLAVLATIIATAALVACGGGGGATTPVVTPPPAPTPVNAAMTATVTPADGATGVARDVKLIVTFTTNAGNFASTTATETCGGVSQALTASMPVTSGKTTTVNWTVATPRLYGATCTYQVLGTATGTDGGAQVNTNTRGTFTVEQLVCSKPGEQVSADGQTCAPVATAFWPPTNLTPMGVKVLGTEFAQLPAGCTTLYATAFTPSSGFSACWKDFVKTNKMKWVQTSRTMVGTTPSVQATRPIVFAAFITPKGRFQVMVMYADTGDTINQFDDIDGMVTPEGIDFMVGNDQGYIFREKVSTNCWQLRWNPPTTVPNVSSNVWDGVSVSCPQ